MLLDGGLRDRAAELLDVRRDRDRLDITELQPAFVAPIEEAFDRARIRGPRVAVADAGGEEFDEAVAGALSLGAYQGCSASRPARTSAGGGTISSVRTIGDLATTQAPALKPPFL